jgi:hypothetical protein
VERVLRRGRLSVAFRLLLALPQFIALYVLSVVGSLILVVGWFAALVLGRLPDAIAEFLGHVIGYSARVSAYTLLLTDRYPPFQLIAEDYPVRVELAPGKLNRLAVLFRLILLIPAQIVASLVFIGLAVASFFIWLLVLVLGRVPGSLFDATTALVRYNVRCSAYYWLVTAAYPWGLFGDRPAPATPSGEAAVAIPAAGPAAAAGQFPWAAPASEAMPGLAEAMPGLAEAMPAGAAVAGRAEGLEPPRAARRLVLSAGAKGLVVLFLVLGAATEVASATVGAITAGSTASKAESLTAVAAAHDTLVSSGQKYQQDIAACNQQLRCVQAADGELAHAFEAFATEVDRLKFPSSAQDEGAEVQRAGRQFSRALQGLAAAPSVEEYTRLADDVDQISDSFDQRYAALVNELAS